jgi:hypothetical protein
MKSTFLIALVAITLSGCTQHDSPVSAAKVVETRPEVSGMSDDDKHRLYSAALATSDSPLDTRLFKDVCQKIGIYDLSGKPTAEYMSFVQTHIHWGMRAENESFRLEINSKEKARKYIVSRLSNELNEAMR